MMHLPVPPVWVCLLIVVFGLGASVGNVAGVAADSPPGATIGAAEQDVHPPRLRNHSFFHKHCYDCHQGDSSEGGLDLEQLGTDLNDPEVERRWVRVFDRIHAGEMPPPKSGTLSPDVTRPILQSLGDWISSQQQKRQAERGRVQGRRLTSRELDRSLRDLLGIQKPLLRYYQQEPKVAEFSTVAQGQSLSDVNLGEHLKVIDIALDDAFRRAQAPETAHKVRVEAPDLAQRKPSLRNQLPVLREGKAAIWAWGIFPVTYCSIPRTKAPVDGWYRFRFQHSGIQLPQTGSVWGIAYDGDNYLEYGNNFVQKWITAFESSERTAVVECEAWLGKGHSLYIRPHEAGLGEIWALGGQVIQEGELKGQTTRNGHVSLEEGEKRKITGIALDWMEMEKIPRGPTNEEIRRRLFGEIPFQLVDGGPPNPQVEKQLKIDANDPDFWSGVPDQNLGKFVPVSDGVTPEQLDRLMLTMATRAFRRPITKDEIRGYCGLVHAKLAENQDLIAALRLGYRALLCSPHFLCHVSPAGELDSNAVASRLSYMFTGSLPDAELLQLAAEDKLREKAVIHKQVDRLLSGPGGRQFVEDFADEWLDLDQIDFTEPDRKLVPDFDQVVENSMLDETRTYLENMLRDNITVTHLVRSDYTFLNSRLARYYGIPEVKGGELRRVSLKPESHRGGVITQGAVLKVTANGSQTSPVVRGAWIAKRILGEQIPPPPPNISVVEPDVRGTKAIREILEKHRESTACVSCHAKMDPPGFALENFDPGGKWRDKYFQVVNGNLQAGLPVDPSYVLPEGNKFQDIQEFQAIISAQPDLLARNLAQKLIVYGTGAPISFADRAEVERIVVQAEKENYGFRSIIHAVTVSPLFLNK